jgi:hypothetical protein
MKNLVRLAVALVALLPFHQPLLAECLPAPTLVVPADGATVPFGNVNLQWTAVTNATGYEVWIGLEGETPSLYSTAPAASTSVTGAIGPGRPVAWKIRALGAASCEGAFSSERTFETSCPTNGPALVSPGHQVTLPPGSITFDWNAVPGATTYDLELRGDGDWFVAAADLENTAHTQTMAQGDYRWRVRANFDSCDPIRSDERELIIGSACGENPAPSLVSPDHSATVAQPVTFSWSAAPGATGYRLWVHRTDLQAPRLVTTTAATTYTADDLGSGRFDWWVVAVYDGCPDEPSNQRSFEILDDAECPANPAKPTLVSPAEGAAGLSSPLTFRWNRVAGALGYRVIASFDGGEPLPLGSTTDDELTVDVPAGPGWWVVQAFFGESCPMSVSERRTFTVSSGASCANAPAQLLSPSNGAADVASPVTFSWSAVPEAVEYRLFVSFNGADFTFYGKTETTSIERLVPEGTVRWYVVTRFAGCNDVTSAVSTFTTVLVPVCDLIGMGLLEPAPDATVDSPVRMAWSGVAGAEAYRVWVSFNGSAPAILARTSSTSVTLPLPAGRIEWFVEVLHATCPLTSDRGRFTVGQKTSCGENVPPVLVAPVGTAAEPAAAATPTTLAWSAAPNAIAYRVWVAERGDDGFEDVAFTRETSVQVALDPDAYGWFVEALFEGCAPLRSSVAYFQTFATTSRCPVEAPVALSPAGGEVTTSPVTFVWSGVEGAGKYRVFASRTEGEPILVGSTDDTNLTRPMPPGTLRWSVEAVFDRCASTFSAPVEFRIPSAVDCAGASAEPVAPAAGSTQPNRVDFAWNAVSGAVGYALIARANDGSPTVLASTTGTQATVTLPAGTIDWWVLTFFANCDPTESARQRFTIARDAECSTRRAVLLLPADDSPVVTSPVHFQWSAVPDASGYRVWVRQNDEPFAIVEATTDSEAVVVLAPGRHEWYVETLFANCPARDSARAEFRVAADVPCGTPGQPVARVVGQAISGTAYRLRWTPLANVGRYEVQESTTPDFANATTHTTASTLLAFTHESLTAPVQYLYRVRGISDCNDERGTYSDPVGVFVTPPKIANASTEIGSGDPVVQSIFLPGGGSPLSFTATADKPWMTITPSSGTLPAEGMTLTVTANPDDLALGTNTGTVKIQYNSSGKGPQSHAGTIGSIPLSVSLVTPVAPAGKGTPPPDSLIFPVVGHAVGVNDSLFESDIRLTNLSAQTMKYQLNYTPSAVDGTETGSSNTIDLAPNETVALDDVVASVFGSGTISSSVGMLEVRPLTTSAGSTSGLLPPQATGLIRNLVSAASSRTYNFTPNGTFGQFIPATRFADFIGRATGGAAPTILSLQQVAQSSAFRANFGFAEASGKPANLVARVYDTASNLLATIPVNLRALEHLQIGGMLATNGINDLTDGRVEVEVVGGDGKVTAYVSEVDNRTNDPLLVSPVVKGSTLASKWVVPGVAYLSNSSAFWVTDLRVFNAGSTSTPATLTYYPSGNPAGAVTREIVLDAGEIEVLDNVLGDLFAQPNGAGGAIAITTPADAPLTATARTYNSTSNGTYGQYIPAVTTAESAGVADRALHILQLEHSSRFRTNIGLAETSGQPATVQVSVVIPDSITTPVVTIPLAGNEFRQISLADFGLGNALYNARVTVKVVEGNGRVTAYGSAIDSITQDPTYVPAQ